MKVGILTHPLHFNYGGVLQCFALYTYLKQSGYTPIIINRKFNESFFFKIWIKRVLTALHLPRYYNDVKKSSRIQPFIQRYLIRTAPIYSNSKMMRLCKEYHFDAVVVGSDQVWRFDFASNYGYNYFLDFVPSNVIKFSYAASFGINQWGYSGKQTLTIKQLLKSFRGISVREEEGARLCEENLGITPEVLIDPTLLLSTNDYNLLASERLVNGKYVFVYWLGDKSLVKDDIKDWITRGYKVIDINLRDSIILPSIEDWLSYIKYADVVLTDSFHGCVFTLIFGRPLVVKKNLSGGLGRIRTLFNLFNIDEGKMNQIISIDGAVISNCFEMLRTKSKKYIQSILG